MSAHKILIVDDDRRAALAGARAAAAVGLRGGRGRQRPRGARGLPHESPDVVLMDLRLGAESGLDVLKEIRALDPAAAVIMVTAHGDLDDAVSGFRLGLTDFFRKPIDFTALRVALRYRLETERLREVVNRSREADVRAPSDRRHVAGADRRRCT